MKLYSVELSVRVQKFLDKLDGHIRIIIEERLKRLGDVAVPSDAKRTLQKSNICLIS